MEFNLTFVDAIIYQWSYVVGPIGCHKQYTRHQASGRTKKNQTLNVGFGWNKKLLIKASTKSD